MRRARVLRADHRRRRCKPVQVGCTATGTCTCEALVPCVRSSSMHTMGRDCVLVVQNELCFVSYSSSTVTRFGGVCRLRRLARREETGESAPCPRVACVRCRLSAEGGKRRDTFLPSHPLFRKDHALTPASSFFRKDAPRRARRARLCHAAVPTRPACWRSSSSPTGGPARPP